VRPCTAASHSPHLSHSHFHNPKRSPRRSLPNPPPPSPPTRRQAADAPEESKEQSPLKLAQQKLASGDRDHIKGTEWLALLEEAAAGRLQPKVAGGVKPRTSTLRKTEGGVSGREQYALRRESVLNMASSEHGSCLQAVLHRGQVATARPTRSRSLSLLTTRYDAWDSGKAQPPEPKQNLPATQKPDAQPRSRIALLTKEELTQRKTEFIELQREGLKGEAFKALDADLQHVVRKGITFIEANVHEDFAAELMEKGMDGNGRECVRTMHTALGFIQEMARQRVEYAAAQ